MDVLTRVFWFKSLPVFLERHTRSYRVLLSCSSALRQCQSPEWRNHEGEVKTWLVKQVCAFLGEGIQGEHRYSSRNKFSYKELVVPFLKHAVFTYLLVGRRVWPCLLIPPVKKNKNQAIRKSLCFAQKSESFTEAHRIHSLFLFFFKGNSKTTILRVGLSMVMLGTSGTISRFSAPKSVNRALFNMPINLIFCRFLIVKHLYSILQHYLELIKVEKHHRPLPVFRVEWVSFKCMNLYPLGIQCSIYY